MVGKSIMLRVFTDLFTRWKVELWTRTWNNRAKDVDYDIQHLDHLMYWALLFMFTFIHFFLFLYFLERSGCAVFHIWLYLFHFLLKYILSRRIKIKETSKHRAHKNIWKPKSSSQSETLPLHQTKGKFTEWINKRK